MCAKRTRISSILIALPHVSRNATVKVVHFDRDGERTIVDEYVQSPPIGGHRE